ncbi:unnamed protein product [Brassica oleracea var. botrytis]
MPSSLSSILRTKLTTGRRDSKQDVLRLLRQDTKRKKHSRRRSTLPKLRRRADSKVKSRYRAEEPTHTATRHQIIENWHRSTKWKTRSGRFTNRKNRRIELSLTRCPRQGSRDKRPPHAVDPHEQATVAEGAPRNQRPPSISDRSGGAETKRKEKTEIRGRESASDSGVPDAGAENRRR